LLFGWKLPNHIDPFRAGNLTPHNACAPSLNSESLFTFWAGGRKQLIACEALLALVATSYLGFF
jgi:hypothetical protein